jgi:hypothetical protein
MGGRVRPAQRERGGAHLDRGGGAVASGQDGVHQEHVAVCNVGWQLLINHILRDVDESWWGWGRAQGLRMERRGG